MPRKRRTGRWLGTLDGVYYAFWYDPTVLRTKRRSLHTTDREFAERKLGEMSAFAALGEPQRDWWPHVKRMADAARSRARKKKIQFSVTTQFLTEMVERQGHCCAVTGIPLSDKLGFRNPWAPSLDKIDPKGGYTPGNVRIVCMAVNMAMNDWGETVLFRIANAISLRLRSTLDQKM